MKTIYSEDELKKILSTPMEQFTRFGKSDSKALAEIRSRIGLTKTQIYHFLGWTDPAIVKRGSPIEWVAKHRKNYISHPWDEIIKSLQTMEVGS